MLRPQIVRAHQHSLDAHHFDPEAPMICPHCQTAFHSQQQLVHVGDDKDGTWFILRSLCPECHRLVLDSGNGEVVPLNDNQYELCGGTVRYLAYPKATLRPAPPPEVPREFAEDYLEACRVMADSTKASAALSRRCLQNILREKAGVKKGDLASEIQQVIDSGSLPTHIRESIDAVRNIGNFAAHPLKSQTTGSIIPVEAGEAEWNLEVLESLFDFYFVQPERLRTKKSALNAKLKELGKPPIK